jgi:hypothetical protein
MPLCEKTEGMKNDLYLPKNNSKSFSMDETVSREIGAFR